MEVVRQETLSQFPLAVFLWWVLLASSLVQNEAALCGAGLSRCCRGGFVQPLCCRCTRAGEGLGRGDGWDGSPAVTG